MNLPPLIKKSLAEFLGVTLFITAYFGSLFSQSPLGPAAFLEGVVGGIVGGDLDFLRGDKHRGMVVDSDL
jgi:hypothetical protein